MKRQATIAIIVSAIICTMLLVNIPETPAQSVFVIAGWDYPDEYGQGIDTITVQGNSTGDWVNIGNYDYDEESSLEWNASVAIRLSCWSWFNSTLTGVGSTNEGKNYLRHNVTVALGNGTIIFSQQNFTYSNVYTEADPMWYYRYIVILNFLPEYGAIYVVTITYEVFY